MAHPIKDIEKLLFNIKGGIYTLEEPEILSNNFTISHINMISITKTLL